MNSADSDARPPFTGLPDMAARNIGGSVVYASDDFYGDRENLIRSAAPEAAVRMNNRGWVVDSWETGRRRSPGHEHVLVRLAEPSSISGITVDTANSGGGFPPEISIEAASLYGYPTLEQLQEAEWTPIVDRSPAGRNRENHYDVTDPRVYTHVRLNLYPDGSVARLRVHGVAVPDLRLNLGLTNIASLRLGAHTIESSGARPAANNALSPGRGRTISEGWETSRHRGEGHEFLRFRLAAAGSAQVVEIDTFNYMRNAPGSVRVLGRDARGGDGGGDWHEVIPKTEVQPDMRQLLRSRYNGIINEVTLETYPDGGVSRIRVYAELGEDERIAGILRWFNLLPDDHARSVLVEDHGASAEDAAAVVAARPIRSIEEAPSAVRTMVTDPGLNAVPG